MATKSKPAAKKTAARKPAAAHHKPAVAKGKVSKEPVKSHGKPAHAHAPAKTTAHPAAAAKPQPKAVATPRTPVESVSLIDKNDRKSTRLNSSHSQISYAVFCLKKKTQQ